MLLKLGFDQRWINLVMLCVRSVRYSVRVNDTFVGLIIPSRGLRQGCRLSPYLYIICAQGLLTLINKAVRAGSLHEIKVCWEAPSISCLLFAYDFFFFFKANLAECDTMKTILNTYEATSR